MSNQIFFKHNVLHSFSRKTVVEMAVSTDCIRPAASEGT